MIYKTVSLCKWLYPSCPCLNLLPEARTETHCATFTTASIISGLKYGLNCFAIKHLALIMLEKHYISIQQSKICGKNKKRFHHSWHRSMTLRRRRPWGRGSMRSQVERCLTTSWRDWRTAWSCASEFHQWKTVSNHLISKGSFRNKNTLLYTRDLRCYQITS